MPHRTAFAAIVMGWFAFLGREPWLAELASSLAVLAWAFISYQSSADLSVRLQFHLLVSLKVTDFWEATGLTLGLLQLISLVVDYRPMRWLCCLLLSWWWAILAVSIATIDFDAPSWPLYAVYALINFFSVFRLLRQGG